MVFDAFVEGSAYTEVVEHNFGRAFDDFGAKWESKVNTPDSDLRHFGASYEEMAEAISEYQPNVVGISVIFDETIEESIYAAEIVRKTVPDALIVIGGPCATANSDFFLENAPDIDIICLGDGEDTLLEIVEFAKGTRQLEEIKNIAYRGPDGHKKAPSRDLPQTLDHLGHLNYSLVKLERYFDYEIRGIMSRQRFAYSGSNRAMSVITTRGCPYYCSFCSVHIHAGRKYRSFSTEHVLDHLETLVKDLGVKHIHFEDDNLTLDKKRFMDIANGIQERNLKFTWDTPNGVFANTLSEDILVKMKEIGCIYLIVAVESGDQWVVDNIINKKPMKLTNAYRAFEIGKKIGLDMQAFYVIGFPREKMSQIMTTLRMALTCLIKWNVIPHVQIAMANTGTDLYKEAVELGMLHQELPTPGKNALGVRMDRFARPVISTDEFTADQLFDLNKKYHGKFKAVIFAKVLKFAFIHPLVFLKNIKYFQKTRSEMKCSIKEALIILVFTRFLYTSALSREDAYI